MGSRQRPASCGSGPRGRIRTRPMMRPSACGAPANARGARAMCGAALALPAVRATPAEPLRGRLHGGTCASAGRGAPLRPHPPMRGRGSSRPRHRPPSRRHTPNAARNSKREPTSEAVPRGRQAAPAGSRGCTESFIAILQQFPRGPELLRSRQQDSTIVEVLQSVQQHRTVLFVQDVLPHFDDIVGGDADEQTIERGMVQLAERHAVANRGFTIGLGIRDDMRSVEKFLMAQAAERALFPIGLQHPLAKASLMNTRSHGRGPAGTKQLSFFRFGNTQGDDSECSIENRSRRRAGYDSTSPWSATCAASQSNAARRNGASFIGTSPRAGRIPSRSRQAGPVSDATRPGPGGHAVVREFLVT